MKNGREESREEGSPDLDRSFNQTFGNAHGLFKGHTFPGKVLLTRKASLNDPMLHERSPTSEMSHAATNVVHREEVGSSSEVEIHSIADEMSSKIKLSTLPTRNESTSRDFHSVTSGAQSANSARVTKLQQTISEPTVIVDRLRQLAWSGVPSYMRPKVWRLLLGYAPCNSDRREGSLRRKRLEYIECVSRCYDVPDAERSDEEISMFRQIAVDCPRTAPDVSFFQQREVQKSLERILYTWAIRHPASGYVQGINDLATPFLIVFLSEHLEGCINQWTMASLKSTTVSDVEADCYWCLSKMLDGMQDHYTFAQPGIQRLVFKLKDLVHRIDEPLSRHMDEQDLDFLQFAFRWFNCLLIREIPFHLVARLWDTYLAEGDALPDFLVYIAASFLLTWSDMLRKLDFQEMVMFLQRLPTHDWTDRDLEVVLSKAYMWQTIFKNCPSHLSS